jgi:hypothetical protein
VEGNYHWFELRNVPVKSHPGVITNWFVPSTGVHDRKRAEAVLRRLIDIPLQHICVVKPDGDVLYANDWLLDFLGLTFDQVQASDSQTQVFRPDVPNRERKAREDEVSHGVP